MDTTWARRDLTWHACRRYTTVSEWRGDGDSGKNGSTADFNKVEVGYTTVCTQVDIVRSALFTAAAAAVAAATAAG